VIPPPVRADVPVELCAVAAGDEEYLLDLKRVREIVAPVGITPVPRAPPFIEGVASVRGGVVPVVDLRRRLGVEPAADGRRVRFLLLQVGRHRIALVVDAVVEVVRLLRSELRPATGLSGRAGSHLFLGVCGAGRRAGGRLRLLLNVKALLDPSAPWSAAEERRRVERDA